MKKTLKSDVAQAIKLVEEAHKILEEAEGTNVDMFIESADSFLVHCINDLTHLEEKL